MTENNGLMELVNDCAPGKKPEKPSDYALTDLLQKLRFKAVTDKFALKYKLKKAAECGYVEITPKKIQAFLNRKAEAYNKEHPKKKEEDYIGYSISSYLNSYMRAYGQQAATQWDNGLLMRQAQWLAAAQQARREMRPSPEWTPEYAPIQGQPSSYPRIESFMAHTNDYADMAKGKTGKFVWEEMRVEDTAHVPPLEVLKSLEAEQEKKVFDYYTVAEVKGLPDPLLLGRINGSNIRFYLAQWNDDVCLDDLI